MKIKINDKTFDPNIEPVMIVFYDDEERLNVIKHLQDMEPKDGIRKYCIFPEGFDKTKIKQFIKYAFYPQTKTILQQLFITTWFCKITKSNRG